MEQQHQGVMITIYNHGQMIMCIDSYALFQVIKFSGKSKEKPSKEELTTGGVYITFEPHITITEDMKEVL
jgi:hypothetical protein